MKERSELIRETLKKALSRFMKGKSNIEVELCASFQEMQCYRLARGEIVQPQIESNARISARVIADKKTGIAVTNSPATETVFSAIETAYELAKSQKPRDEAGLPAKATKKTLIIEPENQIFSVSKNFERINDWLLFAKEARVALSGKYQVSNQSIVVVNSNETEAVFSFPMVRIEFIAERSGISGYGSYVSQSFEPYPVQLELERAVSKVSHYGEIIEIEPGDYEVILEPEAACEFVELFAIYGFGAKMFQEGRSYVSGKIGKKEFSENFTLYDSSSEESQIKMPFDFEGVLKQKVVLVENGIIKNVVYDTETARKEGKKSTGHALPLPNPHGPAPMHLCLKPGTSSLEKMISKVNKGILITRLNYTNIEDEKNGVITGMTRDGTFLIQKGEIVEPVYDIRFTQSVPEALKNVTEIGNQQKLVSPLFGFSLFSPLKISGFKITGSKKR